MKPSGAADSTTVDWTGWMQMTPAEQAALWAKYRQIVRAESEQALMTNYSRMWSAIWRRRA
jgi:hypothetical protein